MWLISLVAVIVSSYFLARIVANFVGLKFEGGLSQPSLKVSLPKVPVQEEPVPPKDNFKSILERNVFDSKAIYSPPGAGDTTETASNDEDVPVTGDAVKTTLSIKLISTFSVGSGEDERSSCIVSTGKGKDGQDVYQIGGDKSFAPDTKIVRILFNRVEFLHKKRLEFVELEDFAKKFSLNTPPERDEKIVPEPKAPESKSDISVEKKTETSFVLSRAELEAQLANLDKIYTQARVVPYMKDGKASGLRLLSVRPGSIFSNLGLNRGDVLLKINGEEMDMKKGLELFNKLKNESKITIDIERKNSPLTLEYEIK
ncbi:hypothetical protein K1X76_02070 [bacterium]|nr:hypothetical protein [bacterium]